MEGVVLQSVAVGGSEMEIQRPTVEAAHRQIAGGSAGAEVAVSSGRVAHRLAWSLWVISVLLLALSLLLPFVTSPSAFADNLLVNVIGVPALLAYATVGALIASRRPENPIGWIFSGTALLVAVGTASEEYARYTMFAVPGSLPGGLIAAWLATWIASLGLFLMFTFLLLLFPDGKLPSRRWRTTGWLVAASIAMVAVLDALRQGQVTSTLPVENPLGIEFVSEIAVNVEDILILVTILVCILSVIIRFRRAKGDEHHQLKWFAYASVLALAQFAARAILPMLFPSPELAPLYDALLIFSVATFPVAAGIAILKYRLYDIDLLVNRTLVYVPLTAILAGVYSASIALFQKLFVAATGQQSDAAVVITTLILVSSFTPIKNGLQGFVDRRFKEVPDPARKLRAFGEQVRSVVQVSNTDMLTQRLLDETTAAFDSTGGAIYGGQPGQLQTARTAGNWNGEAELSISPTEPSEKLEMLALGARRNGLDYTPKDREVLQDIVDVVAQAIDMRRDADKPTT
jgi:hypothetical protein